jgi:hypothetical protein
MRLQKKKLLSLLVSYLTISQYFKRWCLRLRDCSSSNDPQKSCLDHLSGFGSIGKVLFQYYRQPLWLYEEWCGALALR